MGKGQKYQFEELVPVHAWLGKVVKTLSVLLIALSVIASITLIVLLVQVDKKTKDHLGRLKVFEPNTRGEPPAWSASYISLQVQQKQLLARVSDTVDEVKESDSMKQLVDTLMGYVSHEKVTVEQNKNDTDGEDKKLDTFINTFLVKNSAGQYYNKYFSKYQAGYVGSGCAESSCGQPASKDSLELCIQFCYNKRKEGYYSVSYSPSNKKCYCSQKYTFAQKSGHFHYRFPRAIYGKSE